MQECYPVLAFCRTITVISLQKIRCKMVEEIPYGSINLSRGLHRRNQVASTHKLVIFTKLSNLRKKSIGKRVAPEEPPELLLCKNLALSGKETPKGAKPGENARPQMLATTAPAVLKEVKHIPLRKGIGRGKLRAPLWIMAGLPILQGGLAGLLRAGVAVLLLSRVAVLLLAGVAVLLLSRMAGLLRAGMVVLLRDRVAILLRARVAADWHKPDN